MYNISMEHPRDPNLGQVAPRLYQQHTSQPSRHVGIVLATNMESHSIDVQLQTLRTNDNTPVVIRNVRVGVGYGGTGWGEHNLPWPGQEVELIFTQGITTSNAKATVGMRFYNTEHKPPSHPLLGKDMAYQKGRFTQSEGGSYVFEHPDGQRTSYQAAPHNVEGVKANNRAGGTGKTAVENRMDLAGKKLDQAKKSTNLLIDKTKLMQQRLKQVARLTQGVTAMPALKAQQGKGTSATIDEATKAKQAAQDAEFEKLKAAPDIPVIVSGVTNKAMLDEVAERLNAYSLNTSVAGFDEASKEGALIVVKGGVNEADAMEQKLSSALGSLTKSTLVSVRAVTETSDSGKVTYLKSSTIAVKYKPESFMLTILNYRNFEELDKIETVMRNYGQFESPSRDPYQSPYNIETSYKFSPNEGVSPSSMASEASHQFVTDIETAIGKPVANASHYSGAATGVSVRVRRSGFGD